MGFAEIFGTVVTVLCAIVIAFMFYFKVKGNVVGAVSELIALAEATGMTGADKMALVVTGLHEKVPGVLKGVLHKERLESIAQCIFDWMRKYADEYKNKLQELTGDDGVSVKDNEIQKLNVDASADLVAELLNLTLDSLKEKASAYGVDIDGLSTKKEIIKAIIVSILNKA